MTDLNNFFYTDGVHDVLAVYVNRILAATLRSEYKDTKTLSADLTLTDADTPIQRINCNGADRIVKMPTADAVNNHPFWIVNSSGGAYTITVKSNDGATIYRSINQSDAALMLPDGNGTYKDLAYSVKSNFDSLYRKLGATIMEGLQIIRNSATSISIGVGSCYAENGDFIDVTSALVKSSLSLSANTWYHIYVYLSGGTPAAEVVTTVPALWKGTASSKTGDPSRLYVGSIKTDGSGNVYNFVHNVSMNTITYVKYQLSAAPFRCLSGGTATTATAVSLAGIVPVTAKLAYIRIYNTADQILRTSEDNGVGATQLTAGIPQGNTINQAAYLFHGMDASQQIWYAFAAAVGAGSGNIDVAGYAFER